MKWWYFSFADETRFRGGLLACGETLEGAITQSHVLGCNPGGEIMIVELPLPTEDQLDESPMKPWQLYSREEMEKAGAGPVSLEEMRDAQA